MMNALYLDSARLLRAEADGAKAPVAAENGPTEK